MKRILEEKPHPEQAYRSCLGLLRLAKKYTDKRLEQACSYGFSQSAYSRENISSILENNLDQLIDEPSETNLTAHTHKNIRGSSYYH